MKPYLVQQDEAEVCGNARVEQRAEKALRRGDAKVLDGAVAESLLVELRLHAFGA